MSRPEMTVLLETFDELDEMITAELAQEGLENTPINRMNLLTELRDDMEEELPDSLAKRTMQCIFTYILDNIQRNIDGLDPIPTE